jgi:hypothetical protein
MRTELTSDSVIMSPRNGQLPRVLRVRQSCDTCQTSKIRCGQERPSCRRCTKYNIECVYSLSRRVGRPRPRKTASSTIVTDQVTDQDRQSPSEAQPRPRSQSPPTTTTTTSTTAQDIRPNFSTISPAHDDVVPCIASPQRAGFIPSAQGLTNGQSHEQVTDHFDDHVSYHVNDHLHDDFNERLTCHSNLSLNDQHNGIENQLVTNLQQTSPINFFRDSTVDYGGAAFARLPFCDDDPSFLQCADPRSALAFDPNSALNFELMLSPLQGCGDLGGPFGKGSGSSLPVLTTGTSNEKIGSFMNWTEATPKTCHCSSQLLEWLAEPPTDTSSSNGECEGGEGNGAFLGRAVQKSKVLLEHCFRVLHCRHCGPRLSSALVLCQAMDALSVTMGMGTLWSEGSTEGGPLSSSVYKDEVPLRCGNYSVQGVQRLILVKTLMKNRLTEMHRILGWQCQMILSVGVVNSPCQVACASMASELKERVSSMIASFSASVE